MRESRTLRAMWRGLGNGLTVRLVRHSHRKRGETDRPRLRSTAPALDPTALGPVANTDTKLLFYGLFQKGRVLAQDGHR